MTKFYGVSLYDNFPTKYAALAKDRKIMKPQTKEIYECMMKNIRKVPLNTPENEYTEWKYPDYVPRYLNYYFGLSTGFKVSYEWLN